LAGLAGDFFADQNKRAGGKARAFSQVVIGAISITGDEAGPPPVLKRVIQCPGLHGNASVVTESDTDDWAGAGS